jgi:hypothetical protein
VSAEFVANYADGLRIQQTVAVHQSAIHLKFVKKNNFLARVAENADSTGGVAFATKSCFGTSKRLPLRLTAFLQFKFGDEFPQCCVFLLQLLHDRIVVLEVVVRSA